MEKLVTVDGKADRLPELLEKLGQEGFAVKNVGADAKHTYVYLDPSEMKNPRRLLAAWMGLPLPPEDPPPAPPPLPEPEESGMVPLVMIDSDPEEEPPEKVLFKKVF